MTEFGSHERGVAMMVISARSSYKSRFFGAAVTSDGYEMKTTVVEVCPISQKEGPKFSSH